MRKERELGASKNKIKTKYRSGQKKGKTKMKLHYAIFKDNKYIKGKSTHITKTSELGLLHTSIDKAYEVLKNNPDYTSVTITLRKEPK